MNNTRNIFMIIGDPVSHSLSERMHNAGYAALGLDAEFVFVSSKVTTENLPNAVQGIRSIENIKGITVTIPHKVAIIQFLDSVDETAKKICSVNTVVKTGDKLIGYNTDYIGIVEPLKKITAIKGKKVAILGSGGAARAAVFGLTQNKAIVTIFNRTESKAKALSEIFDCSYASIKDEKQIQNADIIVNTTSVGLNSNISPIAPTIIEKHHIIFDIVYSPYETTLLKDAKKNGATVIHGTEMLLHQGLAQFFLYTKRKAPEDAMRKAIMEGIL